MTQNKISNPLLINALRNGGKDVPLSRNGNKKSLMGNTRDGLGKQFFDIIAEIT